MCIKKQASVIVIRVITDEYTLPLGVWVTREAVRKALANKPIYFSDENLLLKYAKIFLQKKFGLNVDGLFKVSKLIDFRKSQVCLNFV